MAALVGPWYALTFGMVAAGFRYQWGWHYVGTAVVANSAFLLDSVGPVVLVAALGVGATIARAWTRRAAPLPSAACALLFADWTFQTVVPAAIRARYLAPLLPPLLILAADGVVITETWLKRHFPWPIPAAGLAPLLALTIVPPAIAVPVKPSLGFMTAAPEVWRNLPANNRAVLIASNGLREAAAIAALALYDPHPPSLFVVRTRGAMWPHRQCPERSMSSPWRTLAGCAAG